MTLRSEHLAELYRLMLEESDHEVGFDELEQRDYFEQALNVIATRIRREVGLHSDATLRTMPHSEVCVHLGVAGTPMWCIPTISGMVQLHTLAGQAFSFPITQGEAGMHLGLELELPGGVAYSPKN